MNAISTEPPPGPGVIPPFVAPPTDGTRQRRWLAVGVAGGAALVLFVGGLIGLGALLVFGSQMIVQQSQGAVTNYLNAIKAEDYGHAYDLMCPTERSKISKSAFVSSFAGQPKISSFDVATPDVSQTIVVPATIVYTDASSQTVKYQVEQDTSANDFEVCGEVG
jgi:hypothetical protein